MEENAAQPRHPPQSTSVPIGDERLDSNSSASDPDESDLEREVNVQPPPLKGERRDASYAMGRCASAVCACATVVAFVMLVTGVSTSNWIVFSTSGGARNPVLVNSLLSAAAGTSGIDSTRRIEYAVSSYGLWTACYRERKGVLSCSMIELRCKSKVCWTRTTTAESKRTCATSTVAPLGGGHGRCITFQMARLAAAIAAILGVFGAAGSVVVIFGGGKAIPMLAGILTLCSGVFTMVAFVLVYVVLYLNAGVSSIANIGWSLWLVIVSGPLAFVAAIVSCCNASLSEPYREIHEYQAKH